MAEDKKLCNLLFRNMGKISDTCQDQEYSEFLLPFEMLFKDITNLDTGNFNKECVKNKLHKSTHSWFKQVSKISGKILSRDKVKALIKT